MSVQERRWHPLLRQWVIIAESSASRPWSGTTVSDSDTTVATHDPECYLCPRVTRANGEINPDYQGPRAFDNDFPALAKATTIDANHQPPHSDSTQYRQPAAGNCRVLCWSEQHNLSLANMSAAQMQAVVQLWHLETTTLCTRDDIAHVLIFENKGAEVGASNPHPHGQIYASSFVTENAQRMRSAQAEYAAANNGQLLRAMVERAARSGDLIVEQNRHFVAMVPFCARLPYESWIVPLRPVQTMADMHNAELDALAEIYQRQAQRYDRLFQRSAPNITLLHNTPCDGHADNQHCSFYIGMQPPLREPGKLKYLAGYEMGSGNFVNPLAPESAAAQLRESKA